MLSESRTISLLCELVHIPMKHSADALRDVYARVCSTGGYDNFITTAGGARVESQRREEGGFSHLNFTRDRVQFTEDHVGLTVDEFAAKVTSVMTEVIARLRIPVVLAQQVTVRVNVSPMSHKSAEEFLRQKLFRVGSEDLDLLGHPTKLFGFRLMSPETAEQRRVYNVRIESYMRDKRALYIENIGIFKTPIQGQQLPGIQDQLPLFEEKIVATSDFLQERVIPFLERFDRRELR